MADNLYAVHFNEDGLPYKAWPCDPIWWQIQAMDMDNEQGWEQLLKETGADEIVVAPSPEKAALEALKRRMK